MTRLCVLFCFFCAVKAFALTNEELRSITFDQHLGTSIPGDLRFRDSTGKPVEFSNLLDGNRPVILVLGYFHCPMLCTLVNDGLIKALQEFRPGAVDEPTVIEVSIDPHEEPAVAAARKAQYLRQYSRANAAKEWHFLIGEGDAIKRISTAAGFHYAYDAASGEYAHPSGIIVLSPNGSISRYLLGVNYDAAELLDALRKAQKGETGSIAHQLALLCFHYNPLTGKYSLAILKTLRVASALTLAVAAVLIFRLTRPRTHRTGA